MNELLLDELLSVGEAAHKLRVSKATIAAWLCRGKLRRVKAGSRTLVRASDLAAALDLDGKSPAPLRKPTPAPDAAEDLLPETAEPPEADKPAAPQATRRRTLYQAGGLRLARTQKPAPAKT